MKRKLNLSIGLVLLLLGLRLDAQGQRTVHVTFDRWTPRPPGSSWFFGDYFESGVGTHASGSSFTMRWSGDPLFPDNGTAYVQSRGSGVLFFDYWGGSRRFDAVSVDLALYSVANLDPVPVQFTVRGYSWQPLATTTFTVTGELDTEGRPAFHTFYFPAEFRNMLYLSVTPATPLWSLDNLVIYIPEPSVASLLWLGGGLLWAARGRQSGRGSRAASPRRPKGWQR